MTFCAVPSFELGISMASLSAAALLSAADGRFTATLGSAAQTTEAKSRARSLTSVQGVGTP